MIKIFKKIIERMFNRWTDWELYEKNWGVFLSEHPKTPIQIYDLYKKENKFNKLVKYKRVYK